MDWLTFVSSVIGSLAWPGALVAIVFIFRKRLSDLLLNLRRVRHKDTEVEFEQGVEILRKESRELPNIGSAQLPEMESDNSDFDSLMKIAELAPDLAIIEVWKRVEVAAAKAVVRAYPELRDHDLKAPNQFHDLLRKRVFSKKEWSQFNDLRILRNKAVRSDGFELSLGAVETYLEIALETESRLAAYES